MKSEGMDKGQRTNNKTHRTKDKGKNKHDKRIRSKDKELKFWYISEEESRTFLFPKDKELKLWYVGEEES